MKFNKKKIDALLGNEDDTIKTIAIISGVAVGLAVGALFATQSGKTLRRKLGELGRKLLSKKSIHRGQDQLGNLIGDVRGHIRQNAEGLLGPESKRHNSSAIHVPGTTSTAWKNHPEEQSHQQYPLPS